MRQVFFITDDRMTAMIWQGSHLISKYEFIERESAEVAEYLEKSKNIVSSIIVDVLEEEITLTTIPHVKLHERKFLIDRALTRLHRGADFSTAKIVGREKNKRRDDRLLVSGMTSNQPLISWLDLFNKHGVLIKGVYSLPLLTGNILKVLKVKKGLTLLVSRQSKKFIRQSIFKDGKLFYSRNIPASQNLDINSFASDLQKTKKYLENQKLLVTEDSVNVLILSSDRFYSQLAGLDELLPDMDIAYVQHDDLRKTLAIKSEFPIAGQEIFSSLLLGALTENHYGRVADLARYKNKIRENQINYLSVAAAFILIMLTSKFYIDIDVLDYKVEGIEEQISVLKRHNDRLENNLSKLPAKAQQMKVFVDNISDVKQVAKNGMKTSMVAISQIFSAYKNISLLNVKWSVNPAEHTSNSNKRSGSKRRTNSKVPSGGHVLELKVALDFSDLTNQNASRVVERFLGSLQGLKSVKTAIVTKKAIRASSSDRMRGEFSNNTKSQSELSLTLHMEEVSNAS